MDNLITKRESVTYPGLFVIKYKKKVFYNNLWNTHDSLKESRGHVEDSNGNIVIRPFTKVFNYGENNVTIHRDEECIAIRKVNGFMCGVTYVPAVDSVVVSTTGSLDSDFVKMADEFIPQKFKDSLKETFFDIGALTTFLFEICHPNDPHIIPEKYGAHLIGSRQVKSNLPYSTNKVKEAFLDIIAERYGFYRPEWFSDKFGNIMKMAKECKHEGYVVYGRKSNTALKIKSPYYLVLKLFARKKEVQLLDRKKVDEEFYPLLDYVSQHMVEFNLLNEQERINFMVDFINGD